MQIQLCVCLLKVFSIVMTTSSSKERNLISNSAGSVVFDSYVYISKLYSDYVCMYVHTFTYEKQLNTSDDRIVTYRYDLQ